MWVTSRNILQKDKTIWGLELRYDLGSMKTCHTPSKINYQPSSSGNVEGSSRIQRWATASCKYLGRVIVITPVTHLQGDLQGPHNSIYNWSRGPPCTVLMGFFLVPCGPNGLNRVTCYSGPWKTLQSFFRIPGLQNNCKECMYWNQYELKSSSVLQQYININIRLVWHRQL